MVLIDGKLTASEIKQQIALQVAEWTAKSNRAPHLAVILVGDDPASHVYVKGKIKSCEEVGFRSTLIQYDSTITEAELLGAVDRLNKDESLDGFIVQLPLPKHIDESKVTLAIDPDKDVDGFHPTNLGRMVLGLPGFLPATPYGIVQLLERYQIQTSGKKCVVVGRSHIVGTPMALLMSRKASTGNCTVTIAHSRTADLKAETLQADILVVAIGQPNLITADMVKPGAVVIDVGTNRVADASKKSGYTLQGDVDFEAVAPKCSYITPVPGGVGPMTITSLLMNTLTAYKRKHG